MIEKQNLVAVASAITDFLVHNAHIEPVGFTLGKQTNLNWTE